MLAKTETIQHHKVELGAHILRTWGAVRLRVMGLSMLPSLWPGDIVTIERKDATKIVPGDLVLHQKDGRFFIHRLIGKKLARKNTEIHFQTQGDSMPQPDPPFTDAELLGRVSEIERNRRTIAPAQRLAPLMWVIGKILCYSGRLRSLALRLYLSGTQTKPSLMVRSIDPDPRDFFIPFKNNG